MNIVITGAGKGIGFEAAVQMATQGHKVVAVSRNVGAFSTVNHPNVVPVSFDLKNINEYGNLVMQIKKEVGIVDVLLNNAGYLVKKEYYQLTHEDYQNIYTTNVMAPFFLVQSLKLLFRKGSHIVNIGSMGGLNNTSKFPGMSLYSSSKAALAVMTECLATELKESGVFINCLAIGAAETEMVRIAFPGYQPPVTASSMASYLTWFCLNGTKWFNGQVIPVALSSP
jgi:NAD(P)-dependent dehydrogenase (short-subunit alcohol dehydrogenase family)